MTDIERRPIFSYLTDDDLFHCENDSPVDMKIYISQIRLEYQGELDIAKDQLKTIIEAHDRDNKERQRYQNALILITSFDRYPEHTALEIQMLNAAATALSGNTQADIDAVDYWVERVRCLENELKLAVDKRNEMVSIYTNQILGLEEQLRKANEATHD